jgi:hypothetical protein
LLLTLAYCFFALPGTAWLYLDLDRPKRVNQDSMLRLRRK